MLKVEPLIVHDRAILPQGLLQPPGAKAPRHVEAVVHCLDGLPHFHKLLSGDGA